MVCCVVFLTSVNEVVPWFILYLVISFVAE